VKYLVGGEAKEKSSGVSRRASRVASGGEDYGPAGNEVHVIFILFDDLVLLRTSGVELGRRRDEMG
jgi:hypothetical protein